MSHRCWHGGRAADEEERFDVADLQVCAGDRVGGAAGEQLDDVGHGAETFIDDAPLVEPGAAIDQVGAEEARYLIVAGAAVQAIG